MGIDYYYILGITKHATDMEIKEAYRKSALEFHPQRCYKKRAWEKFIVIAEAYDVLSKPKLKAVYDQYGEEGLKKGVPRLDTFIPPYTFHENPTKTYKEFFGTTSPYADLLELVYKPLPLFEFQEGKGVKKKEPMFVRPLALTLYEVYTGGIKKMKVQHRVFIDDTEVTTKVVEKVLTVPIKPGLPPGTEIKFPEAGDQGHTIIPGDVVFVTEDLPHEMYHRHGVNLRATVNISLKEALTGINFTLQTLDFRLLHIPITQVITPEYVKVIPHEGMPCVDDPKTHGNLIINFDIKFPIYLPKSCRIMINKAMNDAKRSGADGSPDHIQQLVFLDKLQRIKK